MQISSGGHFEIQYGGHKGRISSGPISENVCNILMYICAKFGACITKRTTGLLYCFTNYSGEPLTRRDCINMHYSMCAPFLSHPSAFSLPTTYSVPCLGARRETTVKSPIQNAVVFTDLGRIIHSTQLIPGIVGNWWQKHTVLQKRYTHD